MSLFRSKISLPFPDGRGSEGSRFGGSCDSRTPGFPRRRPIPSNPEIAVTISSEHPLSIEEAILEKVRALPPARKSEVLEYVSSLEASKRKPFRNPEGILADLNFTLTEEDIAEARREMWANFPHDDIA